MTKKYPHLFTPLKVGSLTLKNRMEAAPTSIEDFTEREYVPRGWIEYYARKASGGAAVVTVGETPVISATGPTQHHMLAVDDPDIMPYLCKVADAIHQQGAYASLELCHGGAGASRKYLHGNSAIAPSACLAPFDGQPVREMTEEMIQEVIEAFGDAAYRLQRCGFDMCMIHAGHGWLLGQFLSPINNRRTDRWGGSYENRVKIIVEIIKNIHDKCGDGFPVEVRISGTEDCEEGYQLSDCVEFCKLLDGVADLLHISIGTVHGNCPNGGSSICSPSPFEKRGRNVYLAEEIKKHVFKTHVVTVGSIVEPEMMEEILASGKADMVACARTFIADPEFPNKVHAGRDDEVRPCLRCIGCLDDTVVEPQVIRCAVNPEIGRELEYWVNRFTPKAQRSVLVIGGGPAGIEAAITAAGQGHSVTLCEKTGELGGALKCNKHIPFKDDTERYRQWLIRTVEKAGVEIRLNCEVTPELLEQMAPDMTICAIGAKPVLPPIAGIGGKNVMQAVDVHEHPEAVGKNAVIIGAGSVGCELGIWLSMLGRSVTVLEMGDKIIPNEIGRSRAHATTNLREYTQVNMRKNNVAAVFGTRVTAIDEDGVYGVGEDGQQVFFPADTVIIAVGFKPLEDEREALRAACIGFKTAGDCVKVGRIKDATASGHAAGYYIQ